MVQLKSVDLTREDDPGGSKFVEQLDYVAENGERSNQQIIEDAAEDVTDFATSIPEWFEGMSEKTNNLLIEWARTFDRAGNKAANKAEKNLKENKIASWFTRFGRWVQKPMNLLIFGGGVLVVIYILRR